MLTDLRNEIFSEPLWESVRQELHLTPTETQVMRLLCMGYSTKQIALRMHRSAKTSEAHRLRVCDRLNVAGTAELVSTLMIRAFQVWLSQHEVSA